jgi:ketosteroid isomerase-like protein
MHRAGDLDSQLGRAAASSLSWWSASPDRDSQNVN